MTLKIVEPKQVRICKASRAAAAPAEEPAVAQQGAIGNWFLYMLECEGGSIYTGITTDVHARFAAHASGKGARYTRAHRPKRILKIVPCADRSAASKAEYATKKMTAAQKRAFCEAA